jgi:hypothetical protein
MRFLLLKHGQRLNYLIVYIEELQPQTSQRHHKYQQGKEDSWDALRKATSITKRDTKRRH